MGLERILNAESVAVVGASRTETKRGYQAIRTLLDAKFEGRIYPVNPKEKTILGLRCYPRVSDIDDQVDLAFITTPAKTVLPILEDCGNKGVAGAVIIAGGFGEIGAEGRRLEEEMVRTARRYNIRIIGPNTSGMMNLKSGLNLVGIQDAPRGDIALLSQSGNMALTLITEARLKSKKGFSYYVGVGNEADVNFHEYLAFFRQDPDTRAVLMYVEGMRRGREFLMEAHKATMHKPVVLLKSGRTATGKRSAGSHTGALAGMSEVAKGAFQRAGIVVVDNSDELFPVVETLASLPPIKNNSVAILADGGGHATIAADMLTELGVNLPPLSEKTQARLRKILPPAASVVNPIDVAGGADANPAIFADCAEILLKDPQVGGILVVGLFGGYGIRFAASLALIEESAAHTMGKLVQQRGKPIVVHSLYTSVRPHALELLRHYSIPVYDSLEIAGRCIGALAQYGRYLKGYQARTNFVLNWGAKATAEGKALIAAARREGRNSLLEPEAKRLFVSHGIPIGQEQMARSAAEAAAIAARLGGEVALKIVSPDIVHKSDAGGVKLGLKDSEEVRAAFAEIVANAKRFDPTAEIRGVLVTPMAKSGVEVIVGTKIDDQFGPVIMFGLGGVLVEVLRDVSFRVLPLSSYEAKRMIEEIRSAPLLDGYRGMEPGDKKALRRLLLKCSEIVESYPEIQEMDLNPVILHPQGLSVVDARILLYPDRAGEA